jgi:hypothetical protein
LKLTTQSEVLALMDQCQQQLVKVYKKYNIQTRMESILNPEQFIKTLCTSVYPNNVDVKIVFVLDHTEHAYRYYHGHWQECQDTP